MHLEAIDNDLWYVVKTDVPKVGEGVTAADVKRFAQLDSITKNIICGHLCRCQNRQISGRGAQAAYLRIGCSRGRQVHDVYPGSGPLDGGNTLLPARLILTLWGLQELIYLEIVMAKL